MPFRRLLPLIVLSLTACAPAHVPWANSAVPKEQWASDWSTCKRRAEDSVMGYQSESQAFSGPLGAYDRAQAKRQVDGEVAQCMYDLGYLPARKDN